MARRFRITVDGQAYEVEVEEIGQAAAQPAASAIREPVPRPEPRPVAAAQPKPQPRPAAPSVKPVPAAAQRPAGKGTITAPIPGVISAVKVQVGQKVKARDVLMMLEAMKMQNEILAPHDGVVKDLFVSTGATVNTGDPLLTVDPE